MASLASINVKFSTDLSEFQSGMQQAQKEIDQFSSKMRNWGAGLTASVTAPLTLLGVEAVQTAAKFEQLKMQMKTAFQGNEELSKAAYKEVQQFASKTPYAMEEAIQSFIKLKNLGLDPSIESLTSYGNTASAMGKSLDQMIEAVADASVGEFERLKEFGIKAKSEGDNVTFTFQGVSTTVKKNSTEIQEYLRRIGDVNFAGAMTDQANTFNGQMSNLRDNIDQIMADIGDILIEFIKPLNEMLSEAVTWFQELSDETKKWIVILGGIAAAIGPILMLAGTTLPLLVSGFAALSGPVGLVLLGITGIAVAIASEWDNISAYVTELTNDFIDLYNESNSFRILIQSIILSFKNFWDVGKAVLGGIGRVFLILVETLVDNFTLLFKVLDQAMSGDIFGAIETLGNGLGDNFVKTWSGIISEVESGISSIWSSVKENFAQGVVNVQLKTKLEHKSLEESATKTKAEAEEIIQNILSGKKGEKGNKAVSMSGIQIEAVGLSIIDPIMQFPDQLNTGVIAFATALTAWQEQMAKFNQEMARQMEMFVENMVSGFAESLGGLIAGTVTLKGVLSGMLGMMADFVMKYGKMLIQYGIGVIAFQTSFSNPYAAIAAGAGLVLLGSLIKNMMAAPKLANGGIAFGETLATVGEYSGARSNPEVIAPLNKLRSLLNVDGGGFGGGEVVFRQRGTDLEGVLKRQSFVDNKIS